MRNLNGHRQKMFFFVVTQCFKPPENVKRILMLENTHCLKKENNLLKIFPFRYCSFCKKNYRKPNKNKISLFYERVRKKRAKTIIHGELETSFTQPFVNTGILR